MAYSCNLMKWNSDGSENFWHFSKGTIRTYNSIYLEFHFSGSEVMIFNEINWLYHKIWFMSIRFSRIIRWPFFNFHFKFSHWIFFFNIFLLSLRFFSFMKLFLPSFLQIFDSECAEFTCHNQKKCTQKKCLLSCGLESYPGFSCKWNRVAYTNICKSLFQQRHTSFVVVVVIIENKIKSFIKTVDSLLIQISRHNTIKVKLNCCAYTPKWKKYKERKTWPPVNRKMHAHTALSERFFFFLLKTHTKKIDFKINTKNFTQKTTTKGSRETGSRRKKKRFRSGFPF